MASASLFRALLLLWEVHADIEDHRYLYEIEHRHSTLQQGAPWGRLEPTVEQCHKMSPGDWHSGYDRWAQRTERGHTHLKEQAL